MQTKKITLSQLDEAVKLIQAGEVVAFQTETVYGLGADARSDEAVAKIYEAKGRPSDNPLIVHIANVKDVEKYTEEITPEARLLMEKFWPGPLTLILPVKENTLSTLVTAGLKTVGLRMPATDSALSLIRESGAPIAAPSANTSGRPSPTTAEHVIHDLRGKIPAVLDSGTSDVGVESTVIDVSVEGKATLLRPGGIPREDLEEVIGPIEIAQQILTQDSAPASPGMKYKHYAPDEPVIIISKEEFARKIEVYQAKNIKIGLLADEEVIAEFNLQVEATFNLGEADSPSAASRNLFSGLRYFENTEAEIIIAQSFPKTGMGLAYMNRLEKAAGSL